MSSVWPWPLASIQMYQNYICTINVSAWGRSFLLFDIHIPNVSPWDNMLCTFMTFVWPWPLTCMWVQGVYLMSFTHSFYLVPWWNLTGSSWLNHIQLYLLRFCYSRAVHNAFSFCFCFCSAVQLILQKCPDAANTQKNDGYTALHLAACMDHSEVAKILLKKVIHTIITPPFSDCMVFMFPEIKTGDLCCFFLIIFLSEDRFYDHLLFNCLHI